ncbi:MAG: RNA methyltransferase [Acidobacteriota bacterium]
MLIERITSKQNPLVKRFRQVRAGNERHLLFIEGIRLVEDAIRAGAHFESVAYSLALESSERGRDLQDELLNVRCRAALVPQPILEHMADTETPQGIVAIVSRPYFELNDVFADNSLIIIADGLQDPGNMGTMIRTAEAAGASGIVTTRQTVDPFNLKALRASMGSVFRLPIVTGAAREEIISTCKARGVKIVATRAQPKSKPLLEDVTKAQPVLIYTEVDFTTPSAFVLGREASGVSEELFTEADVFAHIPMAEGIESLNVAAAATVLLYEAARQRQFTFKSKNQEISQKP